MGVSHVCTCGYADVLIFATRLYSNMECKSKLKSVSEIGYVAENGKGFRARICIAFEKRIYVNGPKRTTRELAYADLNAARVGATSYEDAAAALKHALASTTANNAKLALAAASHAELAVAAASNAELALAASSAKRRMKSARG